jgi:hypothetical protein
MALTPGVQFKNFEETSPKPNRIVNNENQKIQSFVEKNAMLSAPESGNHQHGIALFSQ